jgi:hypothetical protein
MKKIISFIFALLFIELSNAHASDSWTQKQNFSTVRQFAVSFSIGTSGFVGTGHWPGSYEKDLWEFNSITGNWTQKASLGSGLERIEAIGFNIANKGYIGTGMNNSGAYLNDFWEYNPATNTWTQKANFGGAARWDASGFSIGNKGYIGLGSGTGGDKYDFWEYDPITNAWTQKSNLNIGMEHVNCYSIGNKGYVGNGAFYEYDPSVNTWTQKANYPGMAWYQAACFSIGGKGYAGTGENQVNPPYFFNDFWEYNPITNAWAQRADFGGTPRRSGVGFSIGTKGYIGVGFDTSGIFGLPHDLWEYTPICATPITTIYFSGNLSFCNGDSVFLYANNGYNYQWKKNGVDITGATSYFYYAKTTGSYTCYLTNSCGAVTSLGIPVTVNTLLSATITPAGSTTFCSGGSVVLNAPVAANRTYQWKKGTNLISGATLSSYTATTGGNYRVIVTNTVTGCSKITGSATVVTVNTLPSATITPQGPTTFCAGGSVVLKANTGGGLTYKWKKGSNFISGATLSNYSATLGGTYKVEVTNSNGCSKLSAGVVVSVPCREGEITSLKNNLEFNVYPNPNSGEFTIKFSNKPASTIQIELTDELGKVVRRFETSDERVVIKESNLVNGIYCLTARTNKEVLIRKINIVK